MKTLAASSKKTAIEKVRKQFEQWRKTREEREMIPDRLWEKAVSLYPQYPASQISKALRLNYHNLKQRIDNQSTDPCLPAQPFFIDVGVSEKISPSCECIVEIAHSNGARIRMQLTGPNGINLIKQARWFWSRS